jgi:hypothetical protein
LATMLDLGPLVIEARLITTCRPAGLNRFQ